MGASRLRHAAFYAGALLGPFGGALVAPMLDELSDTFDTTRGQAAGSITAYFIPFAFFLLFSGTLGERWGRRRTVRAAYLLSAASSLVCAAAPSLEVLLLGRGGQGVANAFITPLLVAGLAEEVGEGRLGASLGTFVSFQMAGSSLAPAIGGIAGELDWRYGFVAVSFAGVVLAFAPPRGEPRRAAAAPPWRPLLTARLGLLAVSSFASSAGCLGVAFLIAGRARDEFGFGASGAGFILLGNGVAGLATSSIWGRRLGQIGAVRGAALSALGGAALVVATGVVGAGWLLASSWALTGAVIALYMVAHQELTVSILPANRAGAVSAVNSFRFLGISLAPIFWSGLYDRRASLAFAAAGALTALSGLAVLAFAAAAAPARPVTA
ncbi:MAG: MFS transporter [Acidimicrobiales bacterium]